MFNHFIHYICEHILTNLLSESMRLIHRVKCDTLRDKTFIQLIDLSRCLAIFLHSFCISFFVFYDIPVVIVWDIPPIFGCRWKSHISVYPWPKFVVAIYLHIRGMSNLKTGFRIFKNWKRKRSENHVFRAITFTCICKIQLFKHIHFWIYYVFKVDKIIRLSTKNWKTFFCKMLLLKVLTFWIYYVFKVDKIIRLFTKKIKTKVW